MDTSQSRWFLQAKTMMWMIWTITFFTNSLERSKCFTVQTLLTAMKMENFCILQNTWIQSTAQVYLWHTWHSRLDILWWCFGTSTWVEEFAMELKGFWHGSETGCWKSGWSLESMLETRYLFHGWNCNRLKGNFYLHCLDCSFQFDFASQWLSTNHRGSQFSMWGWIWGVQCLHMGSFMWWYHVFNQCTTSKQFGQAQVRQQEWKTLYIMKHWLIKVLTYKM